MSCREDNNGAHAVLPKIWEDKNPIFEGTYFAFELRSKVKQF